MASNTSGRYEPVRRDIDISRTDGTKKMGCAECMNKTPYASVIAMIMVCIGAGVFCGTFYEAIELTAQRIFYDMLELESHAEWLGYMKIIGIIIAVVMVGLAVIFFIFGYLATGATRKNVYTGARCIMGGRVSAIFFMVLAYTMNVCWTILSGVLVIPIMAYMMVRSICAEEVYEKILERPQYPDNVKYCLQLAQFGVYHNTTIYPGTKNTFCDEDMRTLCRYIEIAGPWFIVAYGGVIIMCLGLVHFMIAIMADYRDLQWLRNPPPGAEELQEFPSTHVLT
ncbi:neuronal membrane glycoprotein M6-a-like isoform X2 [Lineus longissimus]|uniref:neuronal membrane glycoprotein M6-a-like isoform X2 n=1 Tax=Lineus longissimus TaxID=88925 RepID=UPI002B4C7818